MTATASRLGEAATKRTRWPRGGGSGLGSIVKATPNGNGEVKLQLTWAARIAMALLAALLTVLGALAVTAIAGNIRMYAIVEALKAEQDRDRGDFASLIGDLKTLRMERDRAHEKFITRQEFSERIIALSQQLDNRQDRFERTLDRRMDELLDAIRKERER